MRISELKASTLRNLKGLGTAWAVRALGDRDLYTVHSWRNEHCIDVEHRGLFYTLGRWTGWEGDFWLVECSTGMIFRGSLAYLKEIIIVCSAAHHEPHGFRHLQP